MLFYQTHNCPFSIRLLFNRCICSTKKLIQCICCILSSGGIYSTTFCQYLVIIIKSINLRLRWFICSFILIHRNHFPFITLYASSAASSSLVQLISYILTCVTTFSIMSSKRFILSLLPGRQVLFSIKANASSSATRRI